MIQFLSRFDGSSSISNMVPLIVFFVVQIPRVFGRHSIYNELEVEEAIDVNRYTRYLNQLRVFRNEVLEFLECGRVNYTAKHYRVFLFGYLFKNTGTLNFKESKTFEERWPLQLEAIDKFKVFF